MVYIEYIVYITVKQLYNATRTHPPQWMRVRAIILIMMTIYLQVCYFLHYRSLCSKLNDRVDCYEDGLGNVNKREYNGDKGLSGAAHPYHCTAGLSK